MQYDRITRWLHAGIALGVSLQLALSLVMQVPEPGLPPGGIAGVLYRVHETLGLAVLGLLAMHWLWQLSGHTVNGLGQLFPWTSAPRRAAVGMDLRRLLALRLRGLSESGPLAGAVHGLGLFAATAMGISGAVLYFGIGAEGSMSPLVHGVKAFHGFIATFMWLYLGGHVAMAVLHQRLGQRTVSEMFNLKR